MQVETLKDVLHWTKEFHHHLSHCLSRGVNRQTDERARMLLNYLADHEQRLSKVVSEFETSGDAHVLNTWCYEYLQKSPIVRHQHCEVPFAKLDAAQIIDVIVDQHQQVIELYRYLSARADIPAAKELLETLESLEEHEIMRMVHSTHRFEDL